MVGLWWWGMRGGGVVIAVRLVVVGCDDYSWLSG